MFLTLLHLQGKLATCSALEMVFVSLASANVRTRIGMHGKEKSAKFLPAPLERMGLCAVATECVLRCCKFACVSLAGPGMTVVNSIAQDSRCVAIMEYAKM